MKLLSLELYNFKGVKSFRHDFGGHDTDIYGDNATGKTTVYDGFLWLLFGKDSTGRKEFSIKPLGADGQLAIQGVEVSAEAVLELDNGSTLKLKRVLAERWERVRGSSEQRFTGNDTNPFIDGLPVPVKAYAERIGELIPEQLFRMLTSPYFFARQSWQDQRKTLFEMCGGINEADILMAAPHLKELVDAKTKADFDRLDRVIQAFRKEREFPVIAMYYLHEDALGIDREPSAPRYTWEEVAMEFGELGVEISAKTAWRWRNRLINDMAICMFGVAAAVSSAKYRRPLTDVQNVSF